MPGARFSIETPATPGAIGVIALHARELDALLERLSLAPVGVGEVVLRDLLSVDRGLVARWNETRADLMPHAGLEVIRRLGAALLELGVEQEPLDACDRYPEAGSPVEARMLAALARAPSERAIDLLLDQPRRWAGVDENDEASATVPPDHLRRLIEPPLVVVAGAPNIGKSTLLNALAGRGVSIVADEAGTTRDHVGVTLELDGLVVRCVDLPGLGGKPGGPDARAQELAIELAARADLALLCGDASNPLPPADALGVAEARVVRVALRSDLGAPPWPALASVCAPDRSGIDALARLVRQRLVPDAALNDPRPWRFWV